MQILSAVHSGGLPVGFLCVAGGGGGGGNGAGGGGGAGGARCSVGQTGGLGTLETMFTPTLGVTYTITVGAGGAGEVYLSSVATNGSNSSIIGTGVSITSTGGGYGGGNAGVTGGGGSGGGGGSYSGPAGVRTASPVQGFNGGSSSIDSPYAPGGGGGGGVVGVSNISGVQQDMAGGIGILTTIETGLGVYFAGGGGGGYRGTMSGPGTGGLGGGGNGGQTANGQNGTANKGGGGGGAAGDGVSFNGGAGGSGVVIINTGLVAASTTGSPTVTGTTYKFTGSGSITF